MCMPMIGGVLSAVGTLYSAAAQSAAYSAEAKAKQYEARATSEAGSYESGKQADRNARLTGQQITAAAASGVDISGSPSEVITDSRSEGEMDKQAIRYNYQFKSNLANYEAKIAKMNSRTAMTGGVIGAIAPLIKGVGSSFDLSSASA